MPIPAFNEHGFLPVGIHDCTLAELKARFGSFSDRRPQLYSKLEAFLSAARASRIVQSVLVDGSFVTSSLEPNDIDLILVLAAAHDFSADLLPDEYNVLSKRRVYRKYGFDLLVASAGSEPYRRYVTFFQQIRFEPARAKGILRVTL